MTNFSYNSLFIRTIAEALDLYKSRTGYHGGCPSCGYPSGFDIREDQGKLLAYCHAGGCSFQEIRQALKNLGLWQPSKSGVATVATAATLRSGLKKLATVSATDCYQNDHNRLVQQLWAKSIPAQGTVVEIYLKSRGIKIEIPPSIRCLPEALHKPSGQSFPVMLAAVIKPGIRRILALHRTYLRTDGSGKADVEPTKMMLGKMEGGSVPLAKHLGVLAVAEGIETALSVYQASDIPTLAALSTSGMVGLMIPKTVQEIIICADHDSPGLKAAYTAAEKWSLQGKKVSIATPPTPKADFNDLLQLGVQD